jgi:hypothetical protein
MVYGVQSETGTSDDHSTGIGPIGQYQSLNHVIVRAEA